VSVAEDSPTLATGPPMTTARRVLIAEDEALIRVDLAEMLVEEGYEVVGQATDGDQAATLAASLRPDLVILDVQMPGKDGITVAAEIVSKQIAPILILTAFSAPDLVDRARDAGAMTYLVKPFSKAALLPAIELAAARHADAVALRAEVANITQRLESLKAIDRAKGLLMTHQKMTEPQAFRWIQQSAMNNRTTMQLVANALVERYTGAGRAEPKQDRGTGSAGRDFGVRRESGVTRIRRDENPA
jgi:AmiR/NasT family two-component response regulator